MMIFDKKIWERSLVFNSPENLPEWPCPTCQNGVVKPDRRSLKFKELANQLGDDEFSSEDFEENFLLGLLVVASNVALKYNEMKCFTQARFIGFLKCSNMSCKEVVTFTGRAKIPNKNTPGKDTVAKDETLLPEYFSPALPILPLTSAYPKKIRLELIRSFSLFFNDTASASNRLRTAIEVLLENQGILNTYIGEDGLPVKNKFGKTKFRNLHNRIEELKERNCDLGEMLLSVKVLGNEGTHSSGLSKYDLLEAYRVIDYVLNELYLRPLRHQEMMRSSADLSKKYC